MSNRFTIPLIGVSAVHTPQTKKIYSKLNKGRKALAFTRQAIMELAQKEGFLSPNGARPDYISNHLWQELNEAKIKSDRTDFNYVIAFFWLKNLPKYKVCSKSRLARLAITEYASQVEIA